MGRSSVKRCVSNKYEIEHIKSIRKITGSMQKADFVRGVEAHQRRSCCYMLQNLVPAFRREWLWSTFCTTERFHLLEKETSARTSILLTAF